MLDQRDTLLNQWAAALDRAAHLGALAGSPLALRQIETIAGPRAGALEIDAGLDAGRLLRALAADDMAVTRQFVPWPFVGQPAVYMQGRYIRIEAGWDDAQAQKMISVKQLNERPTKSGYWLAGMNEYGRAVVMHLSDNAPHFLVAGTTGSGKSVCLRSMVMQFSQRGDWLVLIDGKFGDGLRHLDRLPGAIGPLAVDVETARAALAWSMTEMTRRYEHGDTAAKRIVVVIDEVQELISDPAIVEMIRRIAAQGRAAKIALVLATQHPTSKAFGDDATIKRNVPGRIALRTADYKASEVAVGQATPRSDWLLGAGDAYAVVPGQVNRVQIAYIPDREINQALTGSNGLAEWPPFEAEALPGQVETGSGYAAKEIGVAVASASRGEGRVKFQRALRDVELAASNDKATRLLKFGREVLTAIEGSGASVRPVETDTPDDED